MTPFIEFPKMARLSRDCVVTEKIDGTNAQIFITQGTPITHPEAIHYWFNGADQTDWVMLAGSRTRWITPADDNFGFARWALQNAEILRELGEGQHFGEWWGSGIQRGYGLQKGEKRFSLFNVGRWVKPRTDGPTPVYEGQEACPECCHVVPTLYRGPFNTERIHNVVQALAETGSFAAPGFMKPEGVVVFHEAARFCFKKTIEKDSVPKSLAA